MLKYWFIFEADAFLILFQNLIEVTVTKYGHIDCLINNAGVRKSVL